MAFSVSYIYQIRDKLSPQLKKINRVVGQHNSDLKKTGRMWEKINVQIFKAGVRIALARKEADRLKNELANSWDELLGIAATVASIALPVKQAMEFETAMAGVAKAANLDKGTEQFDRMYDTIRNMTKEIPRTHAEMASMFEAGARLGISEKELPGFARLTAKTAVAFDMMAGTAGDSLASISAKMGIPIKRIESMMDAVNQLENTTAAKGNNMINIIGRIAGAAKSIDISPDQTAGLAAFAEQITVSPELAASGLNMMISRMREIPALHKKLLESPEKAISGMLGQLAKLDKVQRAAVVDKVFGEEAGRFVQTAVESLDVYEKTMGKVADSSQFAGSMSEEFEKQLKTSAVQAQIARNGLRDMGISLGEKLLPLVYEGAILLQKFAYGVSSFIQATGPVVPMIAAFAATLVAFKVAALAAKVAMLGLNVVMAANPIALVVAGIMALIAAFVYAYKKIKPFRDFVDTLWNGFIDKATVAIAWLKEAYNWVRELLGLSGESVDINVNQNVNGQMQPGDARNSVNVDGSVAVDINAPQNTVKDVRSAGRARGRTFAYGGYMGAY